MKRQNRVAFFNILSVILLRGISIFVAPLFTRLLGDSGYGYVQGYNAWVTVIAIVFTLQTYGTLVNARVEYPEEQQKGYQSSVMTLSVLVFLLFSSLVLAFLNPVSRLLKMPRLLVVLMLVQAFGTFCVNFLNTRNVYEFKAGQNMVLSVVVSLTTLVLSLVFVLALPKEVNYYGRISAIAGTYGLLGIPICIAILWRGKTFVRRDYWKFCLVLAIPTVFYNLSDVILGQSDKIMIQQMLSTAQLGRYGAALNFGGIIFTIYAALDNTWRPFFFEDMKQENREQVHAKAVHFLELFTVLAAGFILLTKEVYQIYVAQDFWDGTILIPIFVGSYFLNFLCTFPVNFEYYHKKIKVVAVVTITSSIVNIGLNYVLIRRLGMTGAALATMLSHGLQLAMHHIYVRFLLKGGEYPFPMGVWAPYGLAYVACVGVVLLAWNLPLIRWGIGGILAVWELLRIRKRKVLI